MLVDNFHYIERLVRPYLWVGYTTNLFTWNLLYICLIVINKKCHDFHFDHVSIYFRKQFIF